MNPTSRSTATTPLSFIAWAMMEMYSTEICPAARAGHGDLACAFHDGVGAAHDGCPAARLVTGPPAP